MQERLQHFFRSKRWERFIISLIVVNAIFLGLETSSAVMARVGALLVAIDTVILAVFVVEIVGRIYAFRTSFFRDPWSLFDLTVVGIALVPATGPLTVLRALRILRVLRLISIIPSLRRVIGGLIAALPGMASIIGLLSITFYIFAVMATKLYGETFPEWFGDLGRSMYSLFQIMTLESWSMGIVRPVMEIYPYSWVFFLPFILSTSFVVLNLFIGVIVSAMQENHQAEVDAEHERRHTENTEILVEVKALRAELAEMRGAGRAGMIGRAAPPR